MLPSDIDLSLLTIWLDAHLSPSIAKWITETYRIKAASLRSLGLIQAADIDIFKAAKEANAIIVSKDKDLKTLIDAFGPSPKLIWLTCGNTSNRALKLILSKNFEPILESFIINNQFFIEITD